LHRKVKMNANDEVRVNLEFTEEPELPNWNVLGLDAIYDFLNPLETDQATKNLRKKLNKTCSVSVGVVGNALLKQMSEHSYLDNEKVMQKTLRDGARVNQRIKFLEAKAGKLEFVRNYLAVNISQRKKSDGTIISNLSYSANLLARLVMLGTDLDCQLILGEIFSGPEKSIQRSILDCKAERTITKWKIIADEYFNNPDWAPENVHQDKCSYVRDIDPSLAPDLPWEPEDVRSGFMKLKTHFTVIARNFNKSGNYQEGADHGEGDTLFFDNYANIYDGEYAQNHSMENSKTVFMFMRLCYKDGPPTYMTRDLLPSL
jgi:hypothetical protein